MPLPFILAGAALLAGGYGVKKGIDAKSDFDSAKRWNEKAQELYNTSQRKLSLAREATQNVLYSLATLKDNIYKYSIFPFVEEISKIKNITFNEANLFDGIVLPVMTKDELSKMIASTLEIKSALTGGIVSLGSGGAVGLAVYGGAGLLGTASTGTAISTLSGVTATNATLAWLGGGSLAAGGFGMAGGMVILGGVVAAPVLAVGGMMIASKAEAAKNEAWANYDKAELASEQMKSAKVATETIRARSNEIGSVLVRLDQKFKPLFESFRSLVSSNDNYSTYSKREREVVFLTTSVAKTIRNVLEAPLIDNSGSVAPESLKAIDLANETVASIDNIND